MFLPRRPGGLPAVEKQLVRAGSAAVREIRSEEVTVTLLRFKMACEFSLAEKLKTMGMTGGFTYPAAGLSGMDDRRLLSCETWAKGYLPLRL